MLGHKEKDESTYDCCKECGQPSFMCHCDSVGIQKPQIKLKRDNVKKLSNQEIINIISKRSKKDKEFIMKNL